jgi:membrane-associated protease RseP (regulator of RpoE activity)
MRILTIAAMTVIAGRALAQASVCTNGPGVPFGIRGYTCASCSVLRVDDAVTYVFGTEPTVTQASDSTAGSAFTSVFRPGDVITTMNGKPITSREGGQEFATPRPGENAIGLRRWDGRTLWHMILHVKVRDDCQPTTPYSLQMNRVASFAEKPRPVGSKPPYAIARVDPITPSPDSMSRMGFAVSCTPSCGRVTDRGGKPFWKYDAYPLVVVVRPGGPAAEAGLTVGDLIAEVDGIRVTDEAGSRKLQAYASAPAAAADCVKCEVQVMKLGVIRNGTRREMTIELREKNPSRPHGPPASS